MKTGTWTRRRPGTAWLAAGVGLAALLWSGPATAQQVVPGRMNFQGLLLDSAGEPKNGTVDLVFQLFSAATGGTSLWTETLSNVPVTDGIYDVVLGATASLTSVVASNPTLYLQITVGTEILAPRRQLLVVPYAIRSESAGTADSATNATNALNVGGVSADFVSQVYQYSDFDGNGLLNSDSREGLADVDGDGQAGFIDPDNDNDGLSDATEVAQGSNPNRLTPTVTGFAPTTLPAWAPGSATVYGTKFDLLANLSVTFGIPPAVTPTNVTATSFDVSVAAQPAGPRLVTITSSNGDPASASFTFDANPVIAFVTSTSYNGNLGGVDGADAACQTQANAQSLVGTYKAWIRSSTDSSRINSINWLGNSFVLVGGTQFASNYTTLTQASIHSPVFNLNELGQVVPNGTQVWTGGGSLGSADTCADWTSASPTPDGRFGTVGVSNWQSAGTATNCGMSARLYCFRTP
jgi:hypothetical protein